MCGKRKSTLVNMVLKGEERGDRELVHQLEKAGARSTAAAVSSGGEAH